jgi:hypothetical protein
MSTAMPGDVLLGLRRSRELPATLELGAAPMQGVGARAFGLIVARRTLAQRAARNDLHGRLDPRLMLALTGDEAVLWSADQADLPWFGDAALYLGAPEARVFTRIDMRLTTPRLLLAPCLAALERETGAVPPFLILPPEDVSQGGAGDPMPLRVIDLRVSAPVTEVDWRRIAAEAA